MLSAVVMAHPRRIEMAESLARRLDVPVVWDQKNDVWDTGRRALLEHTDADRHLVLQDDAVVHDDLLAECERLLDYVPTNSPVSLYMGRARHRPRRFLMQPIVDAARRRGASFAVFGGPWWGVGIIVPTAHIEEIVAFGDRSRHTNYDIRIAQYYASQHLDCWYTVPSIVDHRSGPSVVGRGGRGRHAVWSTNGDLGFDWSGGVVTPKDLRSRQPFPVTPR